MGAGRARRVGSVALIVVAGVLLLLGLVAAYARDVAFDADEFSRRANVVRMDDSVRLLLSQTVTRQLVEQQVPQLIAGRPIVESVIAEVIGSSAFDEIYTKALREVHLFFFDGEGESVVLDLADIGVVLSGTLATLDPDLAALIPDDFQAGLVTLADQSAVTDTLQIAESVKVVAFLAPLLALIAFGGGVALARDRRGGRVASWAGDGAG